MTRNSIATALIVVAIVLGSPFTSIGQKRRSRSPVRNDLRNLSWIKGTWQGTGEGTKPFFERYSFQNDSTLVVESFADGTLTRVTNTTRYVLQNGILAGGNEGSRWEANRIYADSVEFRPVAKATNSFTWKRDTTDSWIAILDNPPANGEPASRRVFSMKRWPEAKGAGFARTYVAASGKDKRDCSVDSPCRTINYALSKLNENTPLGSVTIIESGDYEPFEIDARKNSVGAEMSITVIVEAAPGVNATITATGPYQGAHIAVGSQDRVVLRNLHFEATLGNVGISIKSGRWTYVESCSVSNFETGIDIRDPSELFVNDSFFKRNGDGIRAGSIFNEQTGIWTKDPPSVSITNCHFEVESRSAVSVKDGAQVVIRNTVIAGTNDIGVIAASDRPFLRTRLFIENSSITGSGFKCVGLCIDSGAGVKAGDSKFPVEVTLSNNVITQNKIGVIVGLNGTILSYGNNRINGNGKEKEDGTGPDNVRGLLTPLVSR